MKEYISRLKDGCPNRRFIFWWALRLLAIFAFIAGFFKENISITGQLHIAVCIVGLFLWEILMAFPQRSVFRFIPSSVHTFLNIGLFVSAFCGVYLNLYYDSRFFDPVLQFLFGGFAVFYGYEIACAVVKRDRYSATKAMVFYAAFGVCFIGVNAWELLEFFSDQIIGMVTGSVGDAQFWSYELAEGTARIESVIPAIDYARRPLMDTMNDIILNTVSGFLALIFINIYPYRLKGKYKYDLDFGNNETVVSAEAVKR